MTPVTKCQTQHKSPARRETVGAAVHAAVKIAIINTKTAKVANAEAPARVTAQAAPRSSARKARALRVAARR